MTRHLKTSLIVAAMFAATGAMAQTGGAGTTGVVTGSTSATTTTGIAPADGSNLAASPTPGATVQSSSGAYLSSGTGVLVTPGTSTTTVLGAGPVTTTTTTTVSPRMWTLDFPANVEARADFQRHLRLK